MHTLHQLRTNEVTGLQPRDLYPSSPPAPAV
jgi:hypothetical protein